MGYRRDIYSRRDYNQTTKAFSGLIASIIVAPFTAINTLSRYNVSTSNHDASIQNNNINNIRQHKALIRYLSDKTDRSIRSEYFRILESNHVLKKKLDSLEFKIGLYKAKLKIFGFISPYREKWLKVFRKTVRLKHHLENTYKSPVLCLDNYSTSYRKNLKITGHVLLLVNKDIQTGGFLEETAICRRIYTGKSFFEVNKAPNVKLTFGSIDFLFYDDMILIMVENDFIIIEKDAYNIDYRVIHFDGVGVHLPRCSTHWHNVGVIDIKTYSQTISLLFFKKEEGNRFYKLVQNPESSSI